MGLGELLLFGKGFDVFVEKESLLNWARKNKVKSDETTQAEAELKLRELNVAQS